MSMSAAMGGVEAAAIALVVPVDAGLLLEGVEDPVGVFVELREDDLVGHGQDPTRAAYHLIHG